MRKGNICWAAIGAAAFTLAVATSALAQTKLTFQLNWVAGGANAGFAAAVGEGYYKDAGLDVTIVQGNGSGNTAQLVASGRSVLAYADAVAISQLVAKGAPMTVVSTVYQSNPNQVSALKKTGIKSVKDLVGKKVGVPSGSSQTTMLPLFLEGQRPQGVGHDAAQHAAHLDGPLAAAGSGRCHPRIDGRLSDPARGPGRGTRQLPLRRLRRADGEHLHLRGQQLHQGESRMCCANSSPRA